MSGINLKRVAELLKLVQLVVKDYDGRIVK